MEAYNAYLLGVYPPFVVATVPKPPRDLPLTVACAPAYLISPEADAKGWMPSMQHGNNPYASPRVPNPCLNIVRRPWEDSSPEEVELVANKLLEPCSVTNLIFSYPYLTVVLKNDGRTYARHSLPWICRALVHKLPSRRRVMHPTLTCPGLSRSCRQPQTLLSDFGIKQTNSSVYKHVYAVDIAAVD